MPATSINLLEGNVFERSPTTKLLRWALSYGRYIIISTEIIVLLAFIYRFSLDRKNTDLDEEIQQKSAIVETNLNFENQFRNLQERILHINTLTTNQDVTLRLLRQLEQITPQGIQYQSLIFDKQHVVIEAKANSNVVFASFLANLKTSSSLININLSNLSRAISTAGEIIFKIDAQVTDKL